MSVSTYEGTVVNGRIQLRDDVTLPESARVYVVIPDAQTNPQARIRTPRLAHPEETGDFAKQVIEAPRDA